MPWMVFLLIFHHAPLKRWKGSTLNSFWRKKKHRSDLHSIDTWDIVCFLDGVKVVAVTPFGQQGRCHYKSFWGCSVKIAILWVLTRPATAVSTRFPGDLLLLALVHSLKSNILEAKHFCGLSDKLEFKAQDFHFPFHFFCCEKEHSWGSEVLNGDSISEDSIIARNEPRRTKTRQYY